MSDQRLAAAGGTGVGRTNTCPNCHSADVAEIMFGEPAWSPDLAAQIETGEVTLGSCLIGDDSPRFECNACGKRFGDLGWVRP